ncbi:MAG: universal stress protein [Candidatus Aminicenantales bacterium]
MIKIKKILCPVDFSVPSRSGLSASVDLARLFGAKIAICHVLPILVPEPVDPNFSFPVPEIDALIREDAEKRLAALVRDKIPEGIKVVTLLEQGPAGKTIVNFAKETKADLVVIASNGHSGWHDLVLGSVAEKVVRHAPCPVFVVREIRR